MAEDETRPSGNRVDPNTASDVRVTPPKNDWRPFNGAFLGGALGAFLVILLIRKFWWPACVTCAAPPPPIAESPCDSVIAPAPEVVVALTGGTTFEHEIHDCQRLVLATWTEGSDTPSLSFGPLVGIFPLDEAMALRDPSDFAGGRTVATIFNWGGFRFEDEPIVYAPLGIAPGWSCLWLRHDDDTGWQAAIQPADTGCATLSDTTHVVWNLDVEPDTFALAEMVAPVGMDSIRMVPPEPQIPAETTDDPYPPTARWGWDEGTHSHYIGIRCGRKWCSIGQHLFDVRDHESSPNPRLAIPGWYDEEHLAVAGPDGQLIPGPWATIRPTQTAFDIRYATPDDRQSHYRNPEGATVAEILIDYSDPAELGDYVSKWGIDIASDPDTTFIWLTLDGDGGATAEYRRVRDEPGTDTKAVPQNNTLHAAIGAVRWRWMDTDQKQWVSCDEKSCCDIGS
ncbi:MAG TPA: hypothetical protein VMN78_04540 [Longimicrobiales bacterium]|nr:hypothetical protein [Longimicrobiales bacterium]